MSRSASKDWAKRDLETLWHPCTQMHDHASTPPITIRSGQGIWLEDHEGHRYLDAISSWWVNLFGHANPHINRAIKNQLDQLEHVLFAGFSHEPGIKLAEQLLQLAPPDLQRCFYADNGSSAVEIALKMSFHFWLNEGKPEKTRFITLKNSYHGETLGALAVGDVELYKQTYEPLIMTPLTVPSPDAGLAEPGESAESYALRCAQKLDQCLEREANSVCAVIIEPLIQCAGGMRMYHAAYLGAVRTLCDRHNVHLIADEIAVGFGRTGTLFACEQGGISPDFLCLSKGLTGGYLPLSAVLTKEHIYDAFYAEYAAMRAFLHSHSYTGNPLACTAALASLELFALNDVIEQNKTLAAHMKRAAHVFEDHPHVAGIRQTGMVLAIELVKNRENRIPFPWQERIGYQFYRLALKRGVLLRPLGNVIYFMPPYVITPDEITWMFDQALDTLHALFPDKKL